MLALAAGIVGVVLATSAKDESATKAEVTVAARPGLGRDRGGLAAAEDDLTEISDRIDELESR